MIEAGEISWLSEVDPLGAEPTYNITQLFRSKKENWLVTFY